MNDQYLCYGGYESMRFPYVRIDNLKEKSSIKQPLKKYIKYIKETQMLPRNLIDYLEMREIEI